MLLNNAVEWENILLPVLVHVCKMDKAICVKYVVAICVKYVVAKQGHSVSYNDQSEAKKQETAAKRKQQRKH